MIGFILLVWVPMQEVALKRYFSSLYETDIQKALHIPCILPTLQPKGVGISSLYGLRDHPVYGGWRHHDGIDLAVQQAEVVATAFGRVKKAGYSQGYGRFIEIDHGNGYSTLYGHLSEIYVQEGQDVNLAAVIGKSGRTGQVTGEHIHYEVRLDGNTLNPVYFLFLLYNHLYPR